MIVTRFAPSPTGFLHLGHAYAAIVAHDRARAAEGRFRLRMEDIDASRARPEYADAIREDLTWLGLTWDGPILFQSTRRGAHRAALERLDEAGLLYPCFCTRGDIAAEIARSVSAPHGPEGPLYPGTCRGLPAEVRRDRVAHEPYALRLDAAVAAARVGTLSFHEEGECAARGEIPVEPLLCGDIVLARKDVPASYHLAVVVDDAFQGVTLVTRGCDLLPATHVQRLLQALLGFDAPAYAHHRLVVNARGRKFSKRDHSVTLAALRAAGETPEGVRARLKTCTLRE